MPSRVIGIGMRIAVIADIHGNLPAREAERFDSERRDVHRTVNLGDCVSGRDRHRARWRVRQDRQLVARDALELTGAGCTTFWRPSAQKFRAHK